MWCRCGVAFNGDSKAFFGLSYYYGLQFARFFFGGEGVATYVRVIEN